ncbi:MAG TPA: 3-deoxy-D-manno-octulosonic acid transferase [Terriglobales bacterium]|nr:3-deoxy-D-manno-octulosonic acid transferase [Terriglobales bacterium]
MYLLYSMALAVALLVAAPWWLLGMLRHGKYRAGLAERLGRVPARISRGRGAIWVHAVSVGEVLAVSQLIEALRQRYPERRLVISTTTMTAQKLARERFGAENVFYFPLDFAFAIRPWLQALEPELIVMAETEFWPNFLRLAREGGARIAVVNARISNRSFAGYRRWRRLLRDVLTFIDVFLAQSEEDARRLVEIGAPGARVHVSGNLKFDAKSVPSSPAVALLRRALERGGPVIVCGSTVEGEEELLLEAFSSVRQQHAQAVMILAPRHPERFVPVAQMVATSGPPWKRRSELAVDEAISCGIVLLDTLGELAAVYALADLAFVGGSLAPRGGHNILEPAQHGVPVIVGPHTENFRDIVTLFRQADAVRIVAPAELTGTLLSLLGNDAERQALGRRAAEVVRAHAGATERTLEALAALLPATADTREPAPAGRPTT